MEKGKLSRAEVTEQFGADIVAKLDRVNCTPTNRIGYNGSCQGDDSVEFSASIVAPDGAVLTAYYYVDADDDDNNFDNIDWVIAGYEVN